MSISPASRANQPRRITISVPERLIEALDTHVSAGIAASRTDLITVAIEREVQRLRRANIDAEILALADDPEYQALDAQLTAEFEASDAEAWALLETELGPGASG